LAAGYFACLTILDWKSRATLRANLRHKNEPTLEDGGLAEGADAYKVAVLLSIGAAILSLFA
jgi:hypothetical protein